MPVAFSQSPMLPGEWPGRWSTSKERSPASITSPSSTTRVGAAETTAYAGGVEARARQRVDQGVILDRIAAGAEVVEHEVRGRRGHQRRELLVPLRGGW